MNKENIKETLQTLRNKEAWKIVSREMKFTPELIELNEEHIDWDEISTNSEMRWTVDLVSKYQKKINWAILSKSLFDSEEKLACAEHLKIVRTMPEVLDWDVLSESDLPSRSEYLKEFLEKWNWEKIAENGNIIWTNNLFTEFEEHLLPVLSTIALDSLVKDVIPNNYGNQGGRRHHHQYFGYPGLLNQLIENDADRLKVQMLNIICTQGSHANNQMSRTIQNLISKQ
jgi:hypothetical protein